LPATYPRKFQNTSATLSKVKTSAERFGELQKTDLPRCEKHETADAPVWTGTVIADGYGDTLIKDIDLVPAAQLSAAIPDRT